MKRSQSDKKHEVSSFHGMVPEEPSCSEDDDSNGDSKLSPDVQVSDDIERERERSRKKKMLLTQNTIQLLENLVAKRPEQSTKPIEAPDLLRQFDRQDSSD